VPPQTWTSIWHSSRRVRFGEKHRRLYDRASAESIAEHFPGAQIVLSLRDPVERFWSHYLMNEVYRPTCLPANEVLQHSPEGGLNDPLNDLFGMGLYGQQVLDYFDVLGREQVRVTFLESLSTSPSRELRNIQTFLRVDPAPLDTSQRDKECVVPRGPLGRFFLHNPWVGRVGVRLMPPRIRRYLRTRILGDPSRKPEIPRNLKELLQWLYREDCHLLESTLGQPLPWGWHRNNHTGEA
jgi:hypothetical protein